MREKANKRFFPKYLSIENCKNFKKMRNRKCVSSTFLRFFVYSDKNFHRKKYLTYLQKRLTMGKRGAKVNKSVYTG